MRFHKKIFNDLIFRFKNVCWSFLLEALPFVSRMAGVEKQFSNQKISRQQFSRSSPNGNNRQIILIEQSPFPYRNKDQFLRDHL